MGTAIYITLSIIFIAILGLGAACLIKAMINYLKKKDRK